MGFQMPSKTDEKTAEKRRGRPPLGRPQNEILTMRAPPEIIERLKLEQQKLMASSGVSITLSAFAASILERGLDAYEAAARDRRQAERTVAKISKTRELTEADIERLQRGLAK